MSGFKMDKPIVAIILAAGDSKRFGSENKLLVEINGGAILKRVVQAVTGSSVDKTIVVTGEDHELIQSLLSGYDVEFVQNKNWLNGMGASLAVGVGAVKGDVYEGILVCLGDLPQLKRESINKIIDAFVENRGEKIIIPEHKGRRGHPVLFPINLHSELSQLKGKAGAKVIIQQTKPLVIQSASSGIYRDVDLPSDI